MSEPCQVCGETDCDAKRAAFAAEPFLPPGFELGAQWHSHDMGLTWIRGGCAVCHEPTADKGFMTVTAIDQKSGTVTMSVTPAK